MAAGTRFQVLSEKVAEGAHNLQTNTLKVILTNTAPTAADTTFAYPAPTAANGYPAGGNTISVSSSAQSAGLYKLVLADSTFTATAGGIGPFRYAVLMDTTAASGIEFWDYGSSITLAEGEAFTVDFDAGTGALQIS